MIGSEQIYVGGTGGTNNLTSCVRGYNNSDAAAHADASQIYKVEELSTSATVDWRGFAAAPSCIIKFSYNNGVNNMTWNQRINGFKIYMRDVTDGDSSGEWRLFSRVNIDKGTYAILASDDSEIILTQHSSWSSNGRGSTSLEGTAIRNRPIDTYLSENFFTEDTVIDAKYKASEVVGRKTYIGNIHQRGRTYPDRMIATPVNKFDTFPETHYIDVEIGDGDAIVALKSYGDRLLQFKKNKVFVFNVGGDSEVLESEHSNAGISYHLKYAKLAMVLHG